MRSLIDFLFLEMGPKITESRSFSSQVKVTWLQLTPFIKSVIIYFVAASYEFFHSNFISTVLKCVPIVCLMIFIFFMGFKFSREYRYHQLIMLGLILSCAGDALLDYKHGILFPLGMLSFGLAHVCFILAFGLRPLKLAIGLGLYIFLASGEDSQTH